MSPDGEPELLRRLGDLRDLHVAHPLHRVARAGPVGAEQAELRVERRAQGRVGAGEEAQLGAGGQAGVAGAHGDGPLGRGRPPGRRRGRAPRRPAQDRVRSREPLRSTRRGRARDRGGQPVAAQRVGVVREERRPASTGRPATASTNARSAATHAVHRSNSARVGSAVPSRTSSQSSPRPTTSPSATISRPARCLAPSTDAVLSVPTAPFANVSSAVVAASTSPPGTVPQARADTSATSPTSTRARSRTWIACSTTGPPGQVPLQPPRHRRHLVPPGRGHEPDRPVGEQRAGPRDRLRAAPVVTDPGEDPGAVEPLRDLLGGRQVRRERLLHEQRQAGVGDLRLGGGLGRGVGERRHAHVHGVEVVAEQGGDVVGDLRPELLGESGVPGRIDVRGCDEGDIGEVREDPGVPGGDTAGSDETDTQYRTVGRVFGGHEPSVPGLSGPETGTDPPMTMTVLVNAGPWLSVPPPGYGGIENVLAALVPELRKRGVRVVLATVGTSTLPVDEQVAVFPDGQFARAAEALQPGAWVWPRRTCTAWCASCAAAMTSCWCTTTRRRSGPPCSPRWARDCPAGAAHPALGPAQAPRAVRRDRRRGRAVGQRRVVRPARHRAAGAAGAQRRSRPPGDPAGRRRRPAPGGAQGRLPGGDGPDHPGTRARPSPRGWRTGRERSSCSPGRSGRTTDADDLIGAGTSTRTTRTSGTGGSRSSRSSTAGGCAGSARSQDEERDGLVASARASLVPIDWEEPGGTAVVESLALGTPVVGFRRGCLPELVEDGRTGLLVDPGDEDALAAATSDAAPAGSRRTAAGRPRAGSPRPGWPSATCGSTTRSSRAAGGPWRCAGQHGTCSARTNGPRPRWRPGPATEKVVSS